MSEVQERIERIREIAPDALLMDGFDDAVIGTAERCGMGPLVAYDYHKCLEVLEKRGMTPEDALDYFHFNCLGAFVGEGTPMFINLEV